MDELGSDEFSATLAAGSEPFYEFCCEFCHEEGKNLEAKGFCMECNENLCSECIGSHQKTRLTKSHTISNQIPKVKPQPSQSSDNDQISTPCPQHGHKVIEYYCGNHKQLGCNVCMTVRHRNCNSVDYLLDIAQTFADSEECNNVLSHLKAIDDRSKNIVDEIQVKQTESDSHHTDVISTIHQARKEINDALDEAERKLQAAVNKVKTDNTIMLNKTATVCSDTSQAVIKVLTDIQSLRDSRRFCQMFVEIKEVEKHVSRLHTCLDEANRNLSIGKARFKANLKLKELVLYADALGTIDVCDATGKEPLKQDVSTGASNKRNPLHSGYTRNRNPFDKNQQHSGMTSQLDQNFGQLDKKLQSKIERPLSTKGTATKTDNDSVPASSRQSTSAKRPSLITAIHMDDININTEGYLKSWVVKTSCTVKGIVVLKSDLLALTDAKNNKVKLVDTKQNKVVNELSVAGSPFAITKVTNNVAVLLCDEKKILLISYSGNVLKIDKEIVLFGSSKSIAAIGSNLLVVYGMPAKIELISQAGITRKIILNCEATNLFRPNNIAVSMDLTLIYVSDSRNNTVTSLPLDGKVKDVYRTSLMIPGGLCLDMDGNVYVCDMGSNSIQLLTPDCKKVKVLLQELHGIKDPLSLSYCPSTNRLYVGMMETNILKVFKLV